MRRRSAVPVCLLLVAAGSIFGQTTQALVRGRIIDSSTGKPLEGARIFCENSSLGDWVENRSGPSGAYFLGPLSAGNYHLRVEKDGFRGRDVYSFEIFIASRVELDIDLRPLSAAVDEFRSGVVLRKNSAVLPLLGPDLELGHSSPLDVPFWKSMTLQSALSYVIDPQQTGELPLAARNVYTMIVTLPGVAAEEVTGRGLGLAVNGQRSSSANFLLDGVENNDYTLTGPFSTVPPESMQEYRITTNNFSAEFGRAAGFVANAITRSGSNSLHGLVYGYLNNDVLNAATFHQNAAAIRRAPQKELEGGYTVGGAILKDRLFFFSSLDRYRNRALADPELWRVPIVDRFRACAAQGGVASTSPVIKLLAQFAPPEPFAFLPSTANACDSTSIIGVAQVARPVSVDRLVLLERLDYRSAGGKDRVMLRGTLSRLKQPDQEYSVYPDFRGDMSRPSDGVAIGYTRSFRRGAFNDLRIAWRDAAARFPRPHPEIPGLALLSNGAVDLSGKSLALPGSLLVYSADGHENNWEANDSFTFARRAHIFSAGAGVLARRQRLATPFFDSPVYVFDGRVNVALSQPQYLLAGVSVRELASPSQELATPPDARRYYSNTDFYGFFQDSRKIAQRFTLSLGVRYEYLGNIQRTGGGDGVLQLAPGPDIQRRLRDAKLEFPNGSTALYPSDSNNWAGRFGAAYNLSDKTVLRAGYGIFYDRLYTNLFVNPTNSTFPYVFCTNLNCDTAQGVPISVSLSNATVLAAAIPAITLGGQSMLWTDPGLRTPYAQSWFGGVQRQITSEWYVEVSQTGSLGRKLITSDILNKPGATVTPSLAVADLIHRSNSGSSSYAALNASLRYRTPRLADFQASYTWSHAIDNQSDPMLGDAFNLSRFNPEAPGSTPLVSTFSGPLNSRIDRGSSDFDIRQSLVFYSVWHLPEFWKGWKRQVAGGWQFSQLANFRTGLPYPVLYNALQPNSQRRPDLLSGTDPNLHTPVAGGVRLLDAKAFGPPAPGKAGTLGRNSFSGPGFWNLDLSVAKSFSIARLGEGRRLQLRADAFNVLNHANLGQPDGDLSSSTFGIASYGPSGSAPAFPPVTPLYASPRRIQLQVKLYF